MKAFNQFLVDLNDGTTHAGLTADADARSGNAANKRRRSE